jgi:hypothetical protein
MFRRARWEEKGEQTSFQGHVGYFYYARVKVRQTHKTSSYGEGYRLQEWKLDGNLLRRWDKSRMGG